MVHVIRRLTSLAHQHTEPLIQRPPKQTILAQQVAFAIIEINDLKSKDERKNLSWGQNRNHMSLTSSGNREIELKTKIVSQYVPKMQVGFLELQNITRDRELNELENTFLPQNPQNTTVHSNYNQIEVARANIEQISIPPVKNLEILHYNQFVTQIQTLRFKNFQLNAQNQQLKERLEKESKEKAEVQTKLNQAKEMYQKENSLQSDKFKQFQQGIEKRDIYIKKLKKRLKQRNLEIRTLNYELQESQTNQFTALEQNQQLLFELSKLQLGEEFLKQKSEILSKLLLKSQLSQHKKTQLGSFTTSSKQNSNLLSVPSKQIGFDSLRNRIDSSRVTRNQSEDVVENNSFLQILRNFPFKNSSVKKQQSSVFKATQNSKINQLSRIKKKAQGLQFDFEVKREIDKKIATDNPQKQFINSEQKNREIRKCTNCGESF